MDELNIRDNSDFIICKFNSLDEMIAENSNVNGSYEIIKEDDWDIDNSIYDDYRYFNGLVKHIEYLYYYMEKWTKVYKRGGSFDTINYEEVCDKPTVNIFLQPFHNLNNSENYLRILTLALINHLKNKYDVNFNLISAVKNSDEIIYLKVNLKSKDEKLDVKKCYFLMTNLRHLIQGSDLYETPINFNKNKAGIIYISSSNEFGIYGQNIEEDAVRFLNNIKLKLEGRGKVKTRV